MGDTISNYLENKLINYLFRGITYTRPSSLYLALYTTAQTDYDSGTEVSGGSYTRMLLPSFDWTSTEIETAYISSSVSFPQATSNWGNIYAWGIKDASQGGNLLFWGNFSKVFPVLSGQIYMVYKEELSISLLGQWSQYAAYTILNWILNITSFENPQAGLYMALGRNFEFGPHPNHIWQGSWTEIPASDYSRIQIRQQSLWNTPSDGATVNLYDIVFTTSALEDWGMVEGVAFYDYSGNPILWGNLINPAALTIYEGDGFKFSSRQISISIS